MVTIQEIRDLKHYWVDDLYTGLRAEQKEDQTYIDDTFLVPEVKSPHKLLRSGIGNQVVNAPAEQIITSHPQALFQIIKGKKETATRLSEEVNQHWLPALRAQNPNVFKEIVKNMLARGESFIQLVHNEKYAENHGLPVLFFAPDSMVVYADSAEDDCGWQPNTGIPNRVILYYQRQPVDVLLHYPSWTNPKARSTTKRDLVEWVAYFDKEVRYFEADGQAVLSGGIQENVYGFTPFIRKYSGFGKRSPEGKMEDLVISDIRRSRDLIKEECAIRSDIASIMHIFAHKPITITLPTGQEISESELKTNLDMGAYSVNVLHLPEGSQVEYGNTILPSAEAYQYLRDIRAEINQRYPFIMAGFPIGQSGRQQDMAATSAFRRYETIVENLEMQFSAAIEMALAICFKLPKQIPETFNKEDAGVTFHCELKLRAEDPLERDRLITLGDRLWAQGNGAIDLRTNLIEFQGRSQVEAEEIIVNLLVDKLTLQNPEVAQVMGMVFAEESGMEEWLQRAVQESQAAPAIQEGLQRPAPKTTQQRVKGEVAQPMGAEMIDMALSNRGARQSPTRFTRSK